MLNTNKRLNVLNVWLLIVILICSHSLSGTSTISVQAQQQQHTFTSSNHHHNNENNNYNNNNDGTSSNPNTHNKMLLTHHEHNLLLQEQYENFLSSIESPITRGHIHRVMKLLHDGHCEHIYLDVGTNIGIQIRKLYEPQHYPLAEVKRIFERYFDLPTFAPTLAPTVFHHSSAESFEDSSQEKEKQTIPITPVVTEAPKASTKMASTAKGPPRRSNVCAFGFEPNPHQSKRLQELEKRYQLAGYPVVIFTETAASVDGKNISFYMEPKIEAQYHEWGASTLNWHKDMQEVTVGSIPLAEFINLLLTNSHINKGRKPDVSKMVMKMDIEGAEYTVLPDLVLNHALCDISLVMCEFHERFVRDHPENGGFFVKSINYLLRKEKHCVGQITSQDDEAYGKGVDTVPWPTQLEAGSPYALSTVSSAASSSLFSSSTVERRESESWRYLRGTETFKKERETQSTSHSTTNNHQLSSNHHQLYPFPNQETSTRILHDFEKLLITK